MYCLMYRAQFMRSSLSTVCIRDFSKANCYNFFLRSNMLYVLTRERWEDGVAGSRARLLCDWLRSGFLIRDCSMTWRVDCTLCYFSEVFSRRFLDSSLSLRLLREDVSESFSFQFLMRVSDSLSLFSQSILFLSTMRSHLVRSFSTRLLRSMRECDLLVCAFSCLSAMYSLVRCTDKWCFSSTFFCDWMKRSSRRLWYWSMLTCRVYFLSNWRLRDSRCCRETKPASWAICRSSRSWMGCVEEDIIILLACTKQPHNPTNTPQKERDIDITLLVVGDLPDNKCRTDELDMLLTRGPVRQASVGIS